MPRLNDCIGTSADSHPLPSHSPLIPQTMKRYVRPGDTVGYVADHGRGPMLRATVARIDVVDEHGEPVRTKVDEVSWRMLRDVQSRVMVDVRLPAGEYRWGYGWQIVPLPPKESPGSIGNAVDVRG